MLINDDNDDENIINDDDEKVKDHCHISGNFKGSAHCNCNINLQLIFQNLRAYDSHSIFCELNKVDVKNDVIPNILGKCMPLL